MPSIAASTGVCIHNEAIRVLPVIRFGETKEPVAEGMVSILEPFIDTLVICTLTGLVILSSGVWQEKFPTTFSQTDTEILAGVYDDQNPMHVNQLAAHLILFLPRTIPCAPSAGLFSCRQDSQIPVRLRLSITARWQKMFVCCSRASPSMEPWLSRTGRCLMQAW